MRYESECKLLESWFAHLVGDHDSWASAEVSNMMALTLQAEKPKIIDIEEYFSEYMIGRVSENPSHDKTVVTSELTLDLDRGSSDIWRNAMNAKALL